jgi:hypothetical protein
VIKRLQVASSVVNKHVNESRRGVCFMRAGGSRKDAVGR